MGPKKTCPASMITAYARHRSRSVRREPASTRTPRNGVTSDLDRSRRGVTPAASASAVVKGTDESCGGSGDGLRIRRSCCLPGVRGRGPRPIGTLRRARAPCRGRVGMERASSRCLQMSENAADSVDKCLVDGPAGSRCRACTRARGCPALGSERGIRPLRPVGLSSADGRRRASRRSGPRTRRPVLRSSPCRPPRLHGP